MPLKLRVTAGNDSLGEIALDDISFWLRGRRFVNSEMVEMKVARHVADASTCKGWLVEDGTVVKQVELSIPRYTQLGEGDTLAFRPGMLSMDSAFA